MTDEVEVEVEETPEEEFLQEGWVFMVHPSLENSKTKATVEAFEEVWEPCGWVLASAEPTPDATSQPKATRTESKQKGA